MVIVLAITALTLCLGLVSTIYIGNDNPVEQACEAVIKQQTGVTIDLSPDEEI